MVVTNFRVKPFGYLVCFAVCISISMSAMLECQEMPSERIGDRIEGAWVVSEVIDVGKMVDELIGMIVIVTAKEIFLVRPVEGNELASLRLSELKSKFAELEKETISAHGFIETDGTEQDADLVFSATHQNNVGINGVSPFDRLTIELKAKIKFPGGEYKSESTIKCRRIAVEEVRRRVRNTVNQCKDQLAIRPREVLLNWMKAN